MDQINLANQELRMKKLNQNYYRIHLMDEDDCKTLVRLYGVNKANVIINHMMSVCESFVNGVNIQTEVINLGNKDALLVSSHDGVIVNVSVFSLSGDFKSGITFHNIFFGYKEGEQDMASNYRMISLSLAERVCQKCA